MTTPQWRLLRKIHLESSLTFSEQSFIIHRQDTIMITLNTIVIFNLIIYFLFTQIVEYFSYYLTPKTFNYISAVYIFTLCKNELLSNVSTV